MASCDGEAGIDSNCDRKKTKKSLLQLSLTGWNHFLDLVGCNTSIDDTYFSNHSIGCLGHGLGSRLTTRPCKGEDEEYYSDCLEEISSDDAVKNSEFLCRLRLKELLEINENASNLDCAMRNKMFHIHFNGHFKSSLVDIDVKIMPEALPWFSKQCQFEKN